MCIRDSIGSSQMEHVDTDSQTFDEIDEHGFSLPEPILFNVLHFLGARDLCYISMVKRSLHTFVNTGAREVLWRHLFIASFGDVDSVRDTLRTNWKDFYKNSTLAKKDYQTGITSVEDRKYYFQRQLCQSNAVYEGHVEDGTAPSVRIVIKVEKWAQSKVDRKILGASGSFAKVGTPLENTPTRRTVSYTHLRAHETPEHLVCRLLLEKKKKKITKKQTKQLMTKKKN
eukprot:TRINITY_DN25237_c0_g1_i2.p1 TRINITY_DN25237_c0_g1~~TRINITY_DN25237_c0_g1_i2.p1  ORF type:complete len:228 (+),score=56.88 TRINITY_DN25237_c0_g1_i2:159-842(+)